MEKRRYFQSGVLHLFEADSEDGVRAAAALIHSCAGSHTIGVAKGDQVLHFTVVVNRVF